MPQVPKIILRFLTRFSVLGVLGICAIFLSSNILLAQTVSILDQAIQALKESRLTEAQGLLEQAVQENPNSPEAHHYLGVLFHRTRQFPLAEQSFLRSLAIDPNNLDGRLRLGILYEETGSIDKAKATYQEVVSRAGQDPLGQTVQRRLTRLEIRSHFSRSTELMREKRAEDALKELEAVIGLDPKNADAYFGMGEIYRYLKQWDPAIGAHQKAIELDPMNYRANLRLGQLYEAKQEWERSLAAYEKVLELKPGGPEAQEATDQLLEVRRQIKIKGLIQEIFDRIDKHEEVQALQKIEELFSMDPQNPMAYYFRGYVADIQERLPEAMSDLAKAKELVPWFLPVYVKLGMVYQKTGDLDGAMALYQHVLDKAKAGDEALGLAKLQMKIAEGMKGRKSALAEAAAALQRGESAAGILSLEKAVLAYPKDVDSSFALATLYLKAGEKEKAMGTLRRAAESNPKSAMAHLQLGQLLMELDQPDEAGHELELARTLGKGTTIVEQVRKKLQKLEAQRHYQATQKEISRGDYAAALREIDTVVALFPEDASALVSRGMIYDRLNRAEDAIASLKKAVELNPQYENARFQLALILEGRGRFEEARAEYETLLALEPEAKTAERVHSRLSDLDRLASLYEHTRLARQRFEEKKYDAVIDETTTLITLDPTNYLAYLIRGLSFSELKRPLDAIEAIRRALELHPKAMQARFALGKIYFDEGRFEEAREQFERVRQEGEGTREWEFAERVLQRLRRMTFSLGYSQTVDSNVAQRSTPVVGVSSSFSTGLNYVLARAKQWQVTANGSAQQSTHYGSQFVGQSVSTYLSGSYRIGERWNLGGGLDLGYSLFQGEKTSRTRGRSAWVSTSGRIPNQVSFRYNLLEAYSFRSASSRSDRTTVSLSGVQQLSAKDRVDFGYAFVTSVNQEMVGSNFAYRSNGVSINYGRQMVQGLSGRLGLSATYYLYSNPDSTTLFREFRRTFQRGLSGSLAYELSETSGLSLSYSYTVSSTNITLSSREQQDLEEILASPIPTVGGDYQGQSITISYNFSF